MEFHFLQTSDGSPSLKFGQDSEAMHNSQGAFAETVYVYGHAVSTAISKNFEPAFCSVGLGLGYNELLTTALILKSTIEKSKVRGESFEAVFELNQNFSDWVFDRSIEPKFAKVYDQIILLCSNETQIDPTEIKGTLRSWIGNGQWKLNGCLNAETKFETKFSCFLFDAFSSKTSPELWSQEFLENFFQKNSLSQSIVSTYARTGSLKRALQKNGFILAARHGFGGKRESTFAIRESKG